jgi:hypothetical protein
VRKKEGGSKVEREIGEMDGGQDGGGGRDGKVQMSRTDQKV